MKSITLNNYRCFEYLSIELRPKLNLFIGDNASGKSTLISAFGSVLNSFFIGFSDGETRFFGLNKRDFTIQQNSIEQYANEKPIKVDFELMGQKASLVLNSVKGRTLQTPLDAIYNFGSGLYNDLFNERNEQVLPLPLLAGFSTADIHRTRKLNSKKFVRYNVKPSFGYYECIAGDGFLPYWTQRLLVLKEARKGADEIEGVRNAIVGALGSDGCGFISDMEVRHNAGEVYYMLIDGREVRTEDLSDGYRRLINIVVDLAFRCMLLNKGVYGLDACKKTKGTVLIDEIDLHLHPRLQQLVIKGLRKAFPEVQFIVTTHAPMVMSGVVQDENSTVFKLTYSKESGYQLKEMNLYGMDVSTIIEVGLGLTPRDKEVDKRLVELFDLIDGGKLNEAWILLRNLKEVFGEGSLPDLTKAETMLYLLNGDHDKDN